MGHGAHYAKAGAALSRPICGLGARICLSPSAPAHYHVGIAVWLGAEVIETALCLLGFQLAGEVLARGLGLPLPGPVLGMLLLFVALSVRRGVPATLQTQVPRFLAHMSLLFIPAGGAVLAYQGLLAEHGARLAAVLALSTLTTLLVPGLALHWMLARRRRRSGHGGH